MTRPIGIVSVPAEEYRRLIDVCNNLIGELSDPGTEALAAVYCAERILHIALTATPVREERGSVQWVYDLTTCPKSEPFLIAYADGDVRMGHYLDNSRASVPWEGIRPLFGAERWDAKIIAWAKRPALATPRKPRQAEQGGGAS
ncbi:hypothetical protein [Brevundimonas naejangsanensis]|uniref:hypothetical protein n=1 Tax=Brevundimonas naejangsanensis TaxID=588932 RepID=UPI00106BFF43|nr:hypothetical protein [Brevundimonas naejangsanensis]QBQ49060.1 hypothetical protein E3U41_10425 [Brevundimonas naejangsanensis]